MPTYDVNTLELASISVENLILNTYIEATQRGHTTAGTEHILAALLRWKAAVEYLGISYIQYVKDKWPDEISPPLDPTHQPQLSNNARVIFNILTVDERFDGPATVQDMVDVIRNTAGDAGSYINNFSLLRRNIRTRR